MDTPSCQTNRRGAIERPRVARSTLSVSSGLRGSARIGAILALALACSGCFAWVRSVQTAVVCKPDAAREAGRQAALAGDPPAESYGAICGVAEPSLNRMYREAYESVDEASRGSERGLLPRVLP